MSYGGEQYITPRGWGGAAGRADEPDLAKLARIQTQRIQITASEQMAPADTSVLTANTQKLTIPAGILRAGDRLRVRALAKVTNQNSSNTVATFLKIGGASGVTLATVAAYDAATDDIHELEADLWIEVPGAALTSKFHSRGKSWRTGGSDARTHVVDDQTRDTTAALDIVFAQQWSANSASNRVKLYELAAELFRTRQAWG